MVAGAGHSAATAAIVDQGVAGLLQHTFFIANDDLRRAEFQQPLQTVVAVDDAAVEIIQVRSGEATTIELNHRTQVGRQDRQYGQNHPFWRGAGLAEGFDDLEALGSLLAALTNGFIDFFAQLGGKLVEVDAANKFEDGLGPHTGTEDVVLLEGFFQFAVAALLQEVHALQAFEFAAQLFKTLHGLFALALKLSLRGVDLVQIVQIETLGVALAFGLSEFDFGAGLFDDSVAGRFGDALKDIQMARRDGIAFFDNHLIGGRIDDIIIGHHAHQFTQLGARLRLGDSGSFKVLLAALLDLLAVGGGEAAFGLADGMVALLTQAVNALKHFAIDILFEFGHVLIDTH